MNIEAHIGMEESQSFPASGTTGLSVPGMRQVTRNGGLRLDKKGQSYVDNRILFLGG